MIPFLVKTHIPTAPPSFRSPMRTANDKQTITERPKGIGKTKTQLSHTDVIP